MEEPNRVRLVQSMGPTWRKESAASRLSAGHFPEATPLNAFFAWNEVRLFHDRRFTVACDIYELFTRFRSNADAHHICVAHLAISPVILWRWRRHMIVSTARAHAARALVERFGALPAVAAARQVVECLLASIGSKYVAAHAAVFHAFETLEAVVDIDALAGVRPRRQASAPSTSRRNILIIKLSALGDFIQALGPAAAIRRYHASDRITLLTTRPDVELAEQTDLFDDIAVDRRPKGLNIKGWLELRRLLCASQFDRVYDLQTSDRSSFYSWLFWPKRRPQWSGIASHCSHPHANLDRYPQHTIDKQAEQLLMAGIYPVPLPACPVAARDLPVGLEDCRFVLLIPGSSPRHLDKRWPVTQYAELSRRLYVAGYLPVIVGAPDEQHIAAAIRATCPEAVDLVGQTDLITLADLATRAAFTVGNDTGATHMAAAGGNPLVVLFSRASEPSRCAPRGGLVRVLTKPDLTDLAAETVFAEAIQVLSGSAEDSRNSAADD